jgi:hypothetical protein
MYGPELTCQKPLCNLCTAPRCRSRSCKGSGGHPADTQMDLWSQNFYFLYFISYERCELFSSVTLANNIQYCFQYEKKIFKKIKKMLALKVLSSHLKWGARLHSFDPL